MKLAFIMPNNAFRIPQSPLFKRIYALTISPHRRPYVPDVLDALRMSFPIGRIPLFFSDSLERITWAEQYLPWCSDGFPPLILYVCLSGPGMLTHPITSCCEGARGFRRLIRRHQWSLSQVWDTFTSALVSEEKSQERELTKHPEAIQKLHSTA